MMRTVCVSLSKEDNKHAAEIPSQLLIKKNKNQRKVHSVEPFGKLYPFARKFIFLSNCPIPLITDQSINHFQLTDLPSPLASTSMYLTELFPLSISLLLGKKDITRKSILHPETQHDSYSTLSRRKERRKRNKKTKEEVLTVRT